MRKADILMFVAILGQSDSMGKVHLLLWKFTHLDENADYMLEMRELHNFLKITKKSIHPKKCSRTFVAYCDRDGDHKISLNEWYTCFGVKGKEYLSCHYFGLWVQMCIIYSWGILSIQKRV